MSWIEKMFGFRRSGPLCQAADRRRPPGKVPTIFNGTPTVERMNGSTAQRNSGFSLLEMIVATTVLSLAIVGLLGLIRASLANAVRVREYDRAAMLARSTMTELLATDPLPVPARLSGRYDDKSGWEARTTPAEMPIMPGIGGVMVAQVNLTVWWNSEGRRKTAVFDGFRRIRIGQEHEGLLQ